MTFPSGTLSSLDRDRFLDLLPEVHGHARRAFRHLRGPDRDDAIADSVAAALLNFASLCRRGIDPMRYSGLISRYAASHARGGRSAGNRRNSREVLGRRAQAVNGFRVELIGREDLADDRTPIPDKVAFRVDFAEFFRDLPKLHRRMASLLAAGTSAKDVAARFGLTPARVTQLRKGWLNLWLAFLGEQSRPIASAIDPNRGGADV